MSALPGPVLPSRLEVWKQAHRIEAMARHAKELASEGSGADLQAALQKIEGMRAVLGDGPPRAEENIR
ncbi:hypothetical protein [Qipengyuania flava]|uniref:hypothetical protein n=1 Tax=Qipengyuania flava TaxID=192812 RepID=UPI00273FB918|nr:hypothetical protein [Qipengyuania flava]